MVLPLRTISHFRTTFNPYSPLSKTCRIFLTMLQTPETLRADSPMHIKISVNRLPRHSTQMPEMTVGFRNGEELTLEVGKKGIKLNDAVDEVTRIGRVIAREASLKE